MIFICVNADLKDKKKIHKISCSVNFRLLKVMMVSPIGLFLIISSIGYLWVIAKDVNQDLVDYYIRLINKRTEEIANYVAPTDARMFEPIDKTMRGIHFLRYILK